MEAITPILMESNFWHEEFFSVCCGLNLSEYDRVRIEDSTPESFDAAKEIDRLCATISKKDGVPKVMVMNDNQMICLAMARERLKKDSKFAKMRGASLKGSAICNFKLLTRELVPGCGGINFQGLKPSEATIPVVEGVGPDRDMILKPIVGNSSANVCKVRSGQPSPYHGLVTEEMGVLEKATLPHIESLSKGIPGAVDCIGLLEEYVPVTVRKVSVDGVICGGVTVPWCVTDNVYMEDAPEIFDALLTPSRRTTPAEQAKIWEKFQQAGAGLHSITGGDMDAQFICIEMFVFDENRVEVMEINPRISANQLPAFRRVLDNGCPFEAMKKMQSGPSCPMLESPTHNGTFCCTLYRSALKSVEDLVLANVEEHGYEAQYYKMTEKKAHVYGYGATDVEARSAAEFLYARLSAKQRRSAM